MLKRISSVLLIVSMLFMLTACGPFGDKKKQADLSTLDSDRTTVDMVIKEAVNTYLVGNTTTTYNGKTAADATVEDVLTQSEISSDVLSRTIDGETYTFVYTNTGDVRISGGEYDSKGMAITASTTIVSLVEWKNNGGDASDSETVDDASDTTASESESSESSESTESTAESKSPDDKLADLQRDRATLNMKIGEAVKAYKAGSTMVKYNKKSVSECTVEDVLTESNIPTDVLCRTIEGVTYTFVYTEEGSVEITGGEYDNKGIAVTADTKISTLGGESASSTDDNNNDRIAEMENDRRTVDMMIKEAVNAYLTGNTGVLYNGKTADVCTVGDVLSEADMTAEVLSRTINDTTYTFVFNSEKKSVEISGGEYNGEGKTLTADMTIASLATVKFEIKSSDNESTDGESSDSQSTDSEKKDDNGEMTTMEKLEKDKSTLNMVIRSAVNVYLNEDSTVKYNGKTAKECTVGDVLTEKNISADILAQTIDGTDYTFVYTKKGTIVINGGFYKNEGKTITADTTIEELAKYKGSLVG